MSADELTAAAIARLAGVGRAAVSNWRSRYPDFPKPVGGTAASPAFSRAQVEAWLSATGKADQLATAGQTETGTQAIGLAAPSAAQLMPERSIADLTSAELLAKVMVSLLPRSTVSAGRDVAGGDPALVLDPACSRGSLLTAAADRFGDRVRLAGQEIDEPSAAAAALNLRGNAPGAQYEIHTGDSLLDNQLRGYLGMAAAVVCEPPLGRPQWPAAELATDPRWEFGIPAPRDGELAWVQHCYAHLRPRGVAVVAVSPRTCVQQTGQQIRAALVRSGVLREVIALPKGMGSAAKHARSAVGRGSPAERDGLDVYLWVLQRPYGAPAPAAVRMIDLSGLPDAADVPYDFAAWLRLRADADPATCRAVPRLELLDRDASLLPSRYVASRADVSAGDLAGVTGRLRALYARIGQGLPGFDGHDQPIRHIYVTLGELERAGALTIRSRETTPLRGDLLLRTLGRPPTVATGTSDDDDGVAQVVELDQARLDSHFVAMFLRTDAAALPVANTLGVLSKDDLRRCRVPRMPLAEQCRYGEAFRYLQELDGALTALAKVSANVIDQAVHGLISGALAPKFTVMNENEVSDLAEGETR